MKYGIIFLDHPRSFSALFGKLLMKLIFNRKKENFPAPILVDSDFSCGIQIFLVKKSEKC